MCRGLRRVRRKMGTDPSVSISRLVDHRSALMVDDLPRAGRVTPKRLGPRLGRLRVVPRFRFGVRGEAAFGDWCPKAHDGGADLLACPCAVVCVGFVEYEYGVGDVVDLVDE